MPNRITTWALAAGIGLAGMEVSTVWANDNDQPSEANPSQTNQNESGWHQRLDRARTSVGTTVEGAANKTEQNANSVGHQAGNVAHEAGGKATTGAQKAGTSTGDAAVTTQVKEQLAAHEPDAAGLKVDTNGGVVTLTGTVDSPYLHQRAVDLARNAKGVKDVQDHITVQNQQ